MLMYTLQELMALWEEPFICFCSMGLHVQCGFCSREGRVLHVKVTIQGRKSPKLPTEECGENSISSSFSPMD